ncbi:MAG: 6,7-dimethyl-8-ribityllumazine synthase [Salinivirgaceae bacterium]|nr:6,7-dimethyl-8-ribityllumazine synthase [Salinivirgaceae bacterium]
MATALKNLSEYDAATIPSGKGRCFVIVVAEWNAQVTNAMAEGAIKTLKENGVEDDDILVCHVPGTFELTYAAARYTYGSLLVNGNREADAVICIGCVIQGETRHFDFICEGVANGLSALNAEGDIPVIFGVLTTDNLQQALDRAGGRLGNKGVEAAVTALKMVQYVK